MIVFENDNFTLEEVQRKDILCLKRTSKRSHIVNFIDHVDIIYEDGQRIAHQLNNGLIDIIIEKLNAGENYHDVWVFYDGKDTELSLMKFLDPNNKSAKEHKFTSTGIKWWKHRGALESYKHGTGKTVVSTHISPEGRCNLKCPYCSVTYRLMTNKLSMDTIEDYIKKLKTRGLKAVITTGGGEPLLYPKINEYFQFLLSQDLQIGLITNGTQWKRLDPDIIKRLTWARVSVNIFEGWEEKIKVPMEHLGEHTTIGFSFVYTSEHESTPGENINQLEILKKVKALADRYNVQYVRLLPNCMLTQKNLLIQHKALAAVIKELDDDRFFHQKKIHEAPSQFKCHQSFFRPYLSEEPWHTTEVPGTVFPCDSIVLNKGVEHFAVQKYGLCSPDKILDYLDGKIKQRFDATRDCTGCVFCNNIKMLDDYVKIGVDQFEQYENEEMLHENFI